MPFTFSHPAIVLPFIALRQRWRSSTGLIIGSMAPDFEKFLRMSLHDPYSHTWKSIFYFNLPIGILTCFLFHLVVRNPLIDHLPYFLRQRFSRFKNFNWVAHFKKHYIIIFLSLFVGIVSHLVWDSFTHKGGRGVELFPFLKQIVLPKPFQRPLFAFLQQILSIIGGLIMVGFIYLLPKETVLRKKSIMGYWILASLVVIAVMSLWFLAGGKVTKHSIVIPPISAALLSLIIVPFLLKIKEQLFTRSSN